MVYSTTAVSRGAVLANVLDAPVAELAVGHDIDVGKDLLDARALGKNHCQLQSPRSSEESADLVFFKTVLENVLDNETARLTESDLVPHASESLVDILHDLGGRLSPPELKELLPDVAGVSMNYRLGNPAEQFVNHDGLVIFRHRIEGLLDNMAAEGVHREAERVAPDCFCDLDDLLWRPMLKAALDQKVAEAIDHQGVGLGDDGFDDLVLLLWGTNLELLLEENRGLLVVVTDDLVDNVLPIAVDVAVQQATVVERLSGGKICLAFGRTGLLYTMLWSALPRSLTIAERTPSGTYLHFPG